MLVSADRRNIGDLPPCFQVWLKVTKHGGESTESRLLLKIRVDRLYIRPRAGGVCPSAAGLVFLEQERLMSGVVKNLAHERLVMAFVASPRPELSSGRHEMSGTRRPKSGAGRGLCDGDKLYDEPQKCMFHGVERARKSPSGLKCATVWSDRYGGRFWTTGSLTFASNLKVGK